MLLRRSLSAVAVLALVACEPKVDQRPLPTPIDAAVFDPTNSRIPLPNDLALAAIPTDAVDAGCPAAVLPNAQAEFLCQFAKAKGFPNDQEVSITVDFARTTYDPAANASATAPVAVSLPSVAVFGAATVPNVAVIRFDTPGVGAVETGSPADVDAATRGTLTLHNKVDATGSRRWPAGAKYVVVVRGGASGVKTAAGGEVTSSATMFILLQAAIANKDLTKLENQGALPGTAPQKAAAAVQLEKIRKGFTQVLAAVRAANPFPVEEIISLQTFAVAPASTTSPTVVEVDLSKGSLPLPIDLLRDPATGLISAQAACALVQGTFNPVTQACSSPASAGFKAIDGFSTTAMALAPVSFPVDAGTVTAENVLLYKLGGAAPELLTDLATALGNGQPGEAKYVTQPSPIQSACTAVNGTSGKCSQAIGLQPAVPAAVPGVGSFFLPPLESDTTYAVVITSRVKDAAGRPLGRSTVAKLILDVTKPLTAGGVSIVGGVDTATATTLTTMKADLAPVLAALPGLPVPLTTADVAMAYTFKTQTVHEVSQALPAAPYAKEAAAGATFSPLSVHSFDTLAVAGIPAAAFPDVEEFVETAFPTINPIDPTTGALNPNQAAWGAEVLTALVAVPKAAAVVNACPGTAGAVKCAPLVVFHHGLNGGRWQMLPLANQFAKAGFLVAAIDMRLHGSRAACQSKADCTDNGDGSQVCTPIGPPGTQGDAIPPGTCSTTPKFDPASLTTASSGAYFVSGNFFRIRDTIRADLIDNSALVLALARPPTPYPQPVANAFADRLLAEADGPIAIDPTAVYYIGQSLGGIVGTQILATNPRYARGVLNVPGGTLTDVFSNAPAFQTNVDALFASLIPGYTRAKVTAGDPAFDPAIASAYLKLLQVAKLTLDPADPINYAGRVKTKLPSPLGTSFGGTPLYYPTTAAFGQVALNDVVVPNPFNFLLLNLTGAPPIPFTLYSSASAAGNSVDHGILLETFSTDASKAAGAVQVQTDATNFLTDGTTVPAASVVLP